jgi:ABC-type transporter Mla subunit MlaD
MGKTGMQDLERAIIISNKSHTQRMDKIEQNIQQLTETMIQSNQVLRKVYDDIGDLQKRLNELESFARQVIESNKAAKVLLKSSGKAKDE